MGILSAFRFAFQNLFFTPVLYGVIASLAIFSATWEKADRLKDQLTDPMRNQQDTFDFIIVGGGSAGAVLAHRLSKYHTVLLLELGGESHPFQAIPALSLFIPNYPATDWSHKSVRQTASCLACRDQKFTFSQGKNLGGSGNLNFLIHLRGHPKDFDNWARITGDDKWSYSQVLPDFQASENFVGTTTDTGAHAVGGPLQIEMPNEIGLANEWNFAGQEMGYPHLDLNGRYDEGFDALYYPIKRGVRQATYRAFIQPVRGRRSLVIRKFAHVNKVLIREGSNDAYGVVYDRHNIKGQYAFASKEVIISAGALQTPKLLMLSGIGPREVLEPCGIPVKADLPVGKGLHDHVSTLLGPFFINSPKTFSYDNDVTARSFLQFSRQGTGPLTTSGFQAAALLASSYAKAKGQEKWPDIQLTLFGMTPHRLFHSDLAHAFGLRESLLQRYLLNTRGKSAFFILVSVARPESRGELRISSTNPYKPPIIDPKYFTDPTGKDMKVMIEGIHKALHLAENTTVFRKCDTCFTRRCFPGCEGHPFRSDAYWECYIRHMTITLNDHVGTAQMGYPSSPYAVLDPDLKVMGVNHLRVVDASVMPTIVGANTQAATIMIAEKASHLILQKWTEGAVNYDVKPNDQYGPPPLPPAYGPPPVVQGPQVPPAHTEDSSQKPEKPNSVVVDDSLGVLTPPGLPEEGEGGYDSFDLLRQKGIETINSINLKSEDQTESAAGVEEAVPSTQEPPKEYGETVIPTTTNTEATNSADGAAPAPSPTPSQDLEPPQDLTAPEDGAYGTTPTIYQQVYDPTTPSSLGRDRDRDRESKAFDFVEAPVENLIRPEEEEEGTTYSSPSPFDDTTTESVLAKGPNGSSLILRRRKKPPGPLGVTVHPRGHLGFEEEGRLPVTKLTPPPPFSSTSIDPLPKDYVVIKQRGQRNRRKKLQDPSSGGSTTPLSTLVTDPFLVGGNIEEPVQNTTEVFTGISTSTSSSIPRNYSTTRTRFLLNRLQNFIPPSPPSFFEDDTKITRDKRKIGGSETERNNSNSNEEDVVVLQDVEDHPIVPVDMDPVPKVIATTTPSVSDEERKLDMIMTTDIPYPTLTSTGADSAALIPSSNTSQLDIRKGIISSRIINTNTSLSNTSRSNNLFTIKSSKPIELDKLTSSENRKAGMRKFIRQRSSSKVAIV